MTDEQIDAMNAGTELDRAVSEATGIPLLENEDGDWFEFHPSENWDDAMRAAEQVGLFSPTRHGFSLGKHRLMFEEPWIVYKPLVYTETGGPWTFDKSGPVAICRAILLVNADNQ